MERSGRVMPAQTEQELLRGCSWPLMTQHVSHQHRLEQRPLRALAPSEEAPCPLCSCGMQRVFVHRDARGVVQLQDSLLEQPGAGRADGCGQRWAEGGGAHPRYGDPGRMGCSRGQGVEGEGKHKCRDRHCCKAALNALSATKEDPVLILKLIMERNTLPYHYGMR